jgi:hypothetical protein
MREQAQSNTATALFADPACVSTALVILREPFPVKRVIGAGFA